VIRVRDFASLGFDINMLDDHESRDPTHHSSCHDFRSSSKVRHLPNSTWMNSTFDSKHKRFAATTANYADQQSRSGASLVVAVGCQVEECGNAMDTFHHVISCIGWGIPKTAARTNLAVCATLLVMDDCASFPLLCQGLLLLHSSLARERNVTGKLYTQWFYSIA
jgi:hypothetical protein